MNGLSAQGVEMATNMRSEGKIYVVVAVVLIIFIGLAIYLFSIDKKLDKLEKNNPK
ncbi:MAG: CcmD family protein [Salibacteraceae bacterium]|jgi:CcmD family protein